MATSLDFIKFKKEVRKLAKVKNLGHLVPGANQLMLNWEQKKTPGQVVNSLKD
jgi:hypothetical protein